MYTDLHTPNCLYSVPHNEIFSFAIPTQSEGVYPVSEMRRLLITPILNENRSNLGCTTTSPEFLNDNDSQQLTTILLLNP